MRVVCVIIVILSGLAVPFQATVANPAEREARIRFNASLPPNCARGWNGRGNGLVAVCVLGGRYQVRFINGRVAVCGAASCMDRAREVDVFLRRRGF